jgi:hypothetical protein
LPNHLLGFVFAPFEGLHSKLQLVGAGACPGRLHELGRLVH